MKKLYDNFGPQVKHGFLLVAITAINNVLTHTVNITSHTKSHTQCYSIKIKNVKNK